MNFLIATLKVLLFFGQTFEPRIGTTHLPVTVTTKMTTLEVVNPYKVSLSWGENHCVLFCNFWLGSISPSLWWNPMHSRCLRWSLDTVLVDLIVQSTLVKVCLRKIWKIGTLSWPKVLLVRYFCSCNDSCWNGESKTTCFGYMESPANFHHRIVGEYTSLSLPQLYLHYPIGLRKFLFKTVWVL